MSKVCPNFGHTTLELDDLTHFVWLSLYVPLGNQISFVWCLQCTAIISVQLFGNIHFLTAYYSCTSTQNQNLNHGHFSINLYLQVDFIKGAGQFSECGKRALILRMRSINCIALQSYSSNKLKNHILQKTNQNLAGDN